jgi:hypothetical protein
MVSTYSSCNFVRIYSYVGDITVTVNSNCKIFVHTLRLKLRLSEFSLTVMPGVRDCQSVQLTVRIAGAIIRIFYILNIAFIDSE